MYKWYYDVFKTRTKIIKNNIYHFELERTVLFNNDNENYVMGIEFWSIEFFDAFFKW